VNRGCAAGGLSDGHLLLGQRRGDKRAGTHARFEVALGEQLRIGIEDREAGYAQFDGELAAGENLLSRTEVAAQDGGAVAIVNLFVERERCGAIYVENGEGCVRDAFHLAILVVMTDTKQVAMATDQLL
jgi:hypothetical protein